MADIPSRLRFIVEPVAGHRCTVAALVRSGTCEYTDYLTRLERSNPVAAAKVLQMLDGIATSGHEVYVRDRTQMEPVGNALFELKPRDQRLLLFQAGVTWIVVSAAPKPKGQQKVQDAWIKEGIRRKAAYLAAP